jgi:tetratricopeptide (TPR) repeat protein
MGTCLLAQGQPAEAMTWYEKAHRQDGGDPRICNNLANIYVVLKKNLERVEILAERAVQVYGERRKRAEDEVRQSERALRELRVRELKQAEQELSSALGTLGQARAANTKLELAIAAWQASLELMPLDRPDARARRLLEIGRAYKRLETPSEAKRHLEQALGTAKDEALRREIKAELR